jgi:hypothetical protein
MVKPYEPDVFEFSTLGLPNFAETALLWHGDALVYYRGTDERTFSPSREDWELFWHRLERIGAWSWHGQYVNPSILDGEEWSVTIIHAGKKLSCSGANSYPSGFDEFRNSLNSLVR